MKRSLLRLGFLLAILIPMGLQNSFAISICQGCTCAQTCSKVYDICLRGCRGNTDCVDICSDGYWACIDNCNS